MREYIVPRFMGYNSYDDTKDLSPGYLSLILNAAITGGKLTKLPGIEEFNSTAFAYPVLALGHYLDSEGKEYALFLGDSLFYALDIASATLTSADLVQTGIGFFNFTMFLDNLLIATGGLPLRRWTPSGGLVGATGAPIVFDLTMLNNRIFAVTEEYVYWNELSNIDNWPSTYWINVDRLNKFKITDIEVIGTFIYIFKENRTYRLDTYADTTAGWQLRPIAEIGALRGGVFNIPEGFTVVVTDEGIYRFDGADHDLMSADITPDIAAIDYKKKRASVFFDETKQLLGVAILPDNHVTNYSFTQASGSGEDLFPGFKLLTTGTGAVTGTDVERYEEDSADVVYTGTGWSTGTSTSLSRGLTKQTKTTGDYATFSFYGGSVVWISHKTTNLGIAKVYIDGVYQQDVDLYSASGLWQQQVYTKTGLSLGAHTIKIECTGTKNASSTDYYVAVDAFDVTGIGRKYCKLATYAAGDSALIKTLPLEVNQNRNYIVRFIEKQLWGVQNNQMSFKVMGSAAYAISGGDELYSAVFAGGNWAAKGALLSCGAHNYLRVDLQLNCPLAGDVATFGVDDIVVIEEGTGKSFIYSMIDKIWYPSTIKATQAISLRDKKIICGALNKTQTNNYRLSRALSSYGIYTAALDSYGQIGPTDFGKEGDKICHHIDVTLKQIGAYNLSIIVTNEEGVSVTAIIDMTGSQANKKVTAEIGLPGQFFTIKIEDNSANPAYEVSHLKVFYV